MSFGYKTNQDSVNQESILKSKLNLSFVFKMIRNFLLHEKMELTWYLCHRSVGLKR